MISKRWAPVCGLAATLLLLGACAAPGPTRDPLLPEQAYTERLERLQDWQIWGFTGRLGLNDGQDGGSGRLDWRNDNDSVALDFRGALGQGAWQLEADPSLARLKRSDGSISRAPDVDTLAYQELGWVLPVSALSWWVRGMAWPGDKSWDSLQINPDGTLAVIEQLGWRVTYSRYVEHAGEQLPSRLLAQRGDTQVKLAVSRWNGGAP